MDAEGWARETYARNVGGFLGEKRLAALWADLRPEALADLRVLAEVMLDAEGDVGGTPDCEWEFLGWLCAWLTPLEEMDEVGQPLSCHSLWGRWQDLCDPFRHEKSDCDCWLCEWFRREVRVGVGR